MKHFAALLFFFALFASFSAAACTTAKECGADAICIEGTCGYCTNENAGSLCSDDSVNSFSADGICTIDGKCEEGTVCKTALRGLELSGCFSCRNESLCDTRASGGFEPDGICLNGSCASAYCVSAQGNYAQSCGPEPEVCAQANEGKACDYVGDGKFLPAGKQCSLGRCAIPAAGQTASGPENNSNLPGIVSSKKQQMATVQEIIFGPLANDIPSFFALAFLSLIFCALVYPRLARYFADRLSTSREKLHSKVTRFAIALFVFISPFLLARLVELLVVFLLLVVGILGLTLFFFNDEKLEKERKAIQV